MIRKSNQLRDHWEKYRKEFEYARDISFDDTCDSLEAIMKQIA